MSRIILGGNYGSFLPTPAVPGQYAIGFEEGAFGTKGDDGVFNEIASATTFPDATTGVFGIARFATSAEARDGDVVAGPVVVVPSDQVMKRKGTTLYSLNITSGPGYNARSVAIGPTTLLADDCVVMGRNAIAREPFSIVIGDGANVASGGGVTDKGSVLIGRNATGRDGAIAIGENANARVGGIAIGNGVDCLVDGAIVLGPSSSYTFSCSPAGEFTMPKLYVNQALSSSASAATHRILVNVNGTNFWLLLRQI
jgi:hypothetical protein